MPIKPIEICPGPNFDFTQKITVELLEFLLEKEPDNGDYLFALGNLHIQEKNYTAAVSVLGRAIEKDPSNAFLHCNIAAAYSQLHKPQEAQESYKKCLELDSGIYLAQINLILSLIQIQELDSAKEYALSAIDLFPLQAEFLAQLAVIEQTQANRELAYIYFEKAFEIDKDCVTARNALALRDFISGEARAKIGNYQDAFSIWHKAYQIYDSAFYEVKEIALGLKLAINEHTAREVIEELFNKYHKQLSSKETHLQSCYSLFQHFYFSLAHFPQLYVAQTELETDLEHWENELEKWGEHPYAIFRIAVSKTYRAELESAYNEFLRCEDNMPAAKQRLLKVKEIRNFTRKVLLLEQGARGRQSTKDLAKEQAENKEIPELEKEEAQLWKSFGFSPSQAKKWKAYAHTAETAQNWSDAGITPTQASSWIESGFLSAQAAKHWANAKIPPQKARHWREHCKLDDERAVQYLVAGFSEPEEILPWAEAFYFPWDAIRWHTAGLEPEQAKKFLALGISNPQEAKQILIEQEREEQNKSEEEN